MDQVIITEVFIRNDVWVLVEIDLIVVFETVQNMLEVFGEARNVETSCYDSD